MAQDDFLSLSFFTSSTESGLSLESLVLDRIANELSQAKPTMQVSKHRIRSLIMAGCVQVDQKPVRNPKLLIAQRIKVSVACDSSRFFAVKALEDTAFALTKKSIVYEDVDILVINKPAGIPSDASFVQSRDHALAATKRYLSLRDKIEQPYLILHHRLDKDSSGLLLFSKNTAANPGLHQLFVQHQIQKTYRALCQTPTKSSQIPDQLMSGETFRLSKQVARVSPKSQAAKWGIVLENGELAITDFRLLQSSGMMLEFEAQPLTGRTHQIRVHLASCALPILGDTLYGGAASLAGMPIARHMLHSCKLEFKHPLTAKPLIIEAPLPADFIACRQRFF